MVWKCSWPKTAGFHFPISSGDRFCRWNEINFCFPTLPLAILLPALLMPNTCLSPSALYPPLRLLVFYLVAVSSERVAPCSPLFFGFAHGCEYSTCSFNNPWSQTPLQTAGSTREPCRTKMASVGMGRKENTFWIHRGDWRRCWKSCSLWCEYLAHNRFFIQTLPKNTPILYRDRLLFYRVRERDGILIWAGKNPTPNMLFTRGTGLPETICSPTVKLSRYIDNFTSVYM